MCPLKEKAVPGHSAADSSITFRRGTVSPVGWLTRDIQRAQYRRRALELESGDGDGDGGQSREGRFSLELNEIREAGYYRLYEL